MLIDSAPEHLQASYTRHVKIGPIQPAASLPLIASDFFNRRPAHRLAPPSRCLHSESGAMVVLSSLIVLVNTSPLHDRASTASTLALVYCADRQYFCRNQLGWPSTPAQRRLAPGHLSCWQGHWLPNFDKGRSVPRFIAPDALELRRLTLLLRMGSATQTNCGAAHRDEVPCSKIAVTTPGEDSGS